MLLSKLYHTPVRDERVIIGEYRVDIEADKIAEKKLTRIFPGLNVLTTVEGKKIIPIQELFRIEDQVRKEKQNRYTDGFNEGYKKGLDVGHQEAQKVIDNFATVTKDAIKQRDILYDEAHRKILELVLEISKKVSFDAGRIDPEITASIISGAIEKLVDKTKIKVKVHPDHLPIMEQQIDRFKGDSTAIKEIVIEPDKRVRYGGCFIETPIGDIDARIESQMEIIAKALDTDEDVS